VRLIVDAVEDEDLQVSVASSPGFEMFPPDLGLTANICKLQSTVENIAISFGSWFVVLRGLPW
jgi:hypothetical protein